MQKAYGLDIQFITMYKEVCANGQTTLLENRASIRAEWRPTNDHKHDSYDVDEEKYTKCPNLTKGKDLYISPSEDSSKLILATTWQSYQSKVVGGLGMGFDYYDDPSRQYKKTIPMNLCTPGMMIIDESHLIRGPKSALYLQLDEARNLSTELVRLLFLSGTPFDTDPPLDLALPVSKIETITWNDP